MVLLIRWPTGRPTDRPTGGRHRSSTAAHPATWEPTWEPTSPSPRRRPTRTSSPSRVGDCKGVVQVASVDPPAAAHARPHGRRRSGRTLSARWARLRRYKPDGFAFTFPLSSSLSWPSLFCLLIPRDASCAPRWVLASASILLLFVGGGLKIANQKVDAQIESYAAASPTAASPSSTIRSSPATASTAASCAAVDHREDAAAVAAVASVAPVPRRR